jgi:hypothetical protein
MNTERLAFPSRAITTRLTAKGQGTKRHFRRRLPKQLRPDALNCDHITNPTEASRLRSHKWDVNSTYGSPELCAWRIGPGVFWIQTTEPRFSRKLEKRQDACRVDVNGVNHFRRTFAIHGRRRKIQRIIDRFLVSTGGHFSGGLGSQTSLKNGGSINVPVGANGENNGIFLAKSGQSTQQGIARDASDSHGSINTAEGIAL